MLEYSLFFISCFVLSTVIIKWLIGFLTKNNLVDRPGDRRAHKKITPRGAGLALVIIFVLGNIFLRYYWSYGNEFISLKFMVLFLIIAGISFMDDIKPLPVAIRFVTHLICVSEAVLIYLYPYRLFHQELPFSIDFILVVIGLVAFLNIYNFMDGIDGLTAVQSIHLSIVILILCLLRSKIIPNVQVILFFATIILAFSVSFFLFNRYPAKIFVGDVGSISLGFLLGLCFILISAGSDRLFAASAIACLYYIADGGLTIIIRLLNGEKIWQPHLKHFFQKAIKKGMSDKEVIRRIIVCNFFLLLLAINSLFSPAISIILAVLVVIITLINFAK